MFIRITSVVLGVAFGCSSVGSAQVHVPGDFADLQDAIDAVSSGETIIVHGGSHDPIEIDKPLTLVGDPMPTIDNSGFCQPCVTLSGPGNGRVVFSRMRLDGFVFTDACSLGQEGIAGTGFAELHVLHSIIEAPMSCCDESLDGGDGIFVDIPYVLVSDSTVVGGRSNYDNFVCCNGYPGGAGIRASSSTVVLLDSSVTGGEGGGAEFYDLQPGECPTACDDIPGGQGGPGVIAARLLRANSTLSGGPGGAFSCPSSGFQCQKPSGTAVSAGEEIDLGSSISGSGEMILGQPWTLAWSASSPVALLAVSPLLIAPVDLGAKGYLFLQPTALSISSLPGGGTFFATGTIPSDVVLVGVHAGLQVYDAVDGLSRPVISSFLP